MVSNTISNLCSYLCGYVTRQSTNMASYLSFCAAICYNEAKLSLQLPSTLLGNAFVSPFIPATYSHGIPKFCTCMRVNPNTLNVNDAYVAYVFFFSCRRLRKGCVLLWPSLCNLARENGDRMHVCTVPFLCNLLGVKSPSTCSIVCVQSKYDFSGNKCGGSVLKSFHTFSTRTHSFICPK